MSYYTSKKIFFGFLLLIGLSYSLKQNKTKSEISIINNNKTLVFDIQYINPNNVNYSIVGPLINNLDIEKISPPLFNESSSKIFLVKNETDLDFLIEKYKTKEGDSDIALVFSDKLNYEKNINFSYPPLFTLQSYQVNQIEKLISIPSTNGEISYSNETLIYPYKYYFISMTVINTIMIILIGVFFFKNKKGQIYLLSIHQLLKYLPLTIFLVSAILILQIYSDYKSKKEEKNEEETNDNQNGFTLYNLAYLFFFAIIKTLIWNSCLLIAYGWEITIYDFRQNVLRKFFCAYLSVYFCFCADKILEITFKEVIFHYFSFVEIKNFIVNFGLFFLVFFMGKKNLKKLNLQIKYVRIQNKNECVPQLKFKKKMIKRVILFAFIYICCYLILLVVQKLFFSKFIFPENSLFSLVNSDVYEAFFSLILVLTYLPKKLPEYFRVYINLDRKTCVWNKFYIEYSDIPQILNHDISIPIVVEGPLKKEYKLGFIKQE